jgi:putative chitinase
MKRIAPEWYDILLQCGCKPTTAAIWSEVFAACVGEGTFSAGQSEVDDFLGQTLHESGMLEHLEEGLNYSAERLVQVWPKRFPTLADARPYARSPEALANRVYGGRMGNTEPGDGWAYRGRGLIQCTGRANYAIVQALTGLPALQNPGLLSQPMPALQSAIAWWEAKIPDAILGDPERVTKIVNGGTVGLAHRIALTDRAGEALG